MTLADTKVQHKKKNRTWSSQFVRILETMIEAQAISAVNIKNTHLKSLSDGALEELGYSKSEISSIRKTPSSSQIR